MKLLVIIISIFYFNTSFAITTGEQPSGDTISATDYAVISDEISNAFRELMYTSYENVEEQDCLVSAIQSSLESADFLWKDLSEINARLVDSVFDNFDKFLAFIKYFHPRRNDPSMTGAGVYALKTFAELAVSNENGKTEIDKESMLMLIDIVKNEPFNLPILPGVKTMLDQVEKIEVSKVSKGEFKGETQIVIHSASGDEIKVGMEEFMAGGMNRTPIDKLKISDGAKIIFHDNEKNSKNKSRDKRIIDYLDDVEIISKKEEQEYAEKYLKSKKNDMAGYLTGQIEPRVVLNFYARDIKNENDQETLKTMLDNITISMETSNQDQSRKALMSIGKAINENNKSKRKKIIKSMTEGLENQNAVVDSLMEYTSTLEEVMTEDFMAKVPQFSSRDIKNTQNFIRNKEYDPAVTPVFFKADGLKVSLKGALGALSDGELDEGVLIPGNASPDGRKTHSLFATGSGTGFIGGWFSKTMPL
jgi:hypothetical protein